MRECEEDDEGGSGSTVMKVNPIASEFISGVDFDRSKRSSRSTVRARSLRLRSGQARRSPENGTLG